MAKELSKYANITRDTIELFKSLCVQCQKKRKRCVTKGVTVKPILVNVQNNSASDNGSEFTASVISKLKLLWPDLLIVHGKPRHPQSQGSVERLNCDIKDMLISWLEDNDTTDWPMGLRFVHFQKNSSYHSGIKQSPYKALFGVDARVGLRSTALPEEVLKTMITEEDLLGAYSFSSDSTRPDESPEFTNPPDDSPECSAPPNDSPEDFAQPGQRKGAVIRSVFDKLLFKDLVLDHENGFEFSMQEDMAVDDASMEKSVSTVIEEEAI
ncbi:KRAB-A domain-containing protein 2-like [Macrobrachium rosenbergii]|uniref:KRAB-A domain-containing protein 2-like n=1 Tax=Macrobrachium rosenbergii TaxID=79674 RepID=UPI0034D60D60